MAEYPNESIIPAAPRITPRRKRARGTVPTTPAAIARYQKVKLAMELRYSGMGWREIALQLGFKSHKTIHGWVQEYLQLDLTEDADTLREKELGTLDMMQQELMKAVLKGEKWAPRSAEVIVKLMERRAALLGLDMASKHEVKVTGPEVVEYFRDPRQDSHRAQLAEVLQGTALESLYDKPTEVIDGEFRELPPALPAPRPPDPGA